MKLNVILNNYLKVIFVNYCMLLILRILETLLITLSFGYQNSLISSELIGLFNDYIYINTILIVVFPIYYIFHKKNKVIANSVFIISISILVAFHLLILKSFLYQQVLLDIFVFQYSIDEIFYTISTSNIGFLDIILSAIALSAIIFFSHRYFKRKTFSIKKITLCYLLIILSVPFIFTPISIRNFSNKYSNNKSFYFYTQSIKHLLNQDKKNTYTIADANNFQELNPSKAFNKSEYILLHKTDTLNPLGSYFNKFDSAPNIVILIIEGLNDDFIHKYRNADLMPFLSSLKDKSLYWNKCFTLGERSFAAAPSILGSLPYGEKGFTLLEKLPRHLSLVSILNSNDYFTSFFYGQGSWFHKKDRFFNHNDIKLIIDNRKFSDKYNKIIVGEDNFFWGYNDKDLFNQSFEVIDTISSNRRLDIYFTGTSHSPYIISNEDYYNKYLYDIISSLTKEEDKEFFNTYKRYIKSILFVDDALKDFFDKYKKRNDYENTIFIITGDHPMTEVPIANSLKRYHVPLLIFSEKLIKPHIISNPVSHLDISESILSLLKPYEINIPSLSAALGNKLYTSANSHKRHFAFMNDNREIVDYYSDGYFISGDQIFEVDLNLNLNKINNNEIWTKLNKELSTFKKTSLHACIENKIIPDEEYCRSLNHTLIYSSHDNNSNKINAKHYDLIPELEIVNQDLIFDIDFKYSGKADDLMLVYKFIDQDDSTQLIKYVGIPKESNFFQAHIKIPFPENTDSTLYFKSYLWNQKKEKIIYSDLNILIHQNK